MKTKSWTQSVREVLMRLPDNFQTSEVYRYEKTLSRQHPENKNVHAKIRQTLQVLRDAGELASDQRGSWRKRRKP